jgi:FtsZ-binding cell division protein ZapB
MDQRLGDAVKKIKSLNLDIEELKEVNESKDNELK